MRAIPYIFFLLFSITLSAQSKKAMKEYEYARQAISNKDYKRAMSHLNKAIRLDPEYVDAYVMRGDLHFKQNRMEPARNDYGAALENGASSSLNYKYALSSMYTLNYAEAERAFKIYLSGGRVRDETRTRIEHYLVNCAFGKIAVLSPVPFDPQGLGAGVNNENHQYHPSISIDGKTLVYTQQNLSGNKRDEDFYYVSKDSGAWGVGKKVQGPLNTNLNEGVQSLTADGLKMFYTICHRDDGYGSCDIYYTEYKGNGIWSEGKNLGSAINSAKWESQPSVSPDGKTLYFVRGSKSIADNVDIYVSEFVNGTWTEARKMPETINTPGKELSPFIHFDNQTLYFSSNGHPGMGEADLFVSRKNESGEWGTPENMGYPINTPFEEFGLVVSSDGKTGFYASNSVDSAGGSMNLYTFQLPEASRALPVAWISGKVFDRESGKPIESNIEAYDLSNDRPWLTMRSDQKGRFFAVLPANNEYSLNVDEKGYLFYSEHFLLEEQQYDSALELQVPLAPIRTGEKIILKNVFFDLDSYALKGTSKNELDKLVKLMKDNSSLIISIEGHTDNQGGDSHNLTLSRNRAGSVKKYLTEKGIDPGRMKTRGWGASNPVDTNDSEEGRRNNRRTEIVVL